MIFIRLWCHSYLTAPQHDLILEWPRVTQSHLILRENAPFLLKLQWEGWERRWKNSNKIVFATYHSDIFLRLSELQIKHWKSVKYKRAYTYVLMSLYSSRLLWVFLFKGSKTSGCFMESSPGETHPLTSRVCRQPPAHGATSLQHVSPVKILMR